MDVRFTNRSRRKLVASWKEPDRQLWSGKATQYRICHSTQEGASQTNCSVTNQFSCKITSLQPSTRYFVTVSAGTSDRFGPTSAEISKITNGGKNLALALKI